MHPSPLTAFNERRKHPRFETSWPGWLITRGGVEACVVKDISAGGARVERTSRLMLPQQVRLVVQDPFFSADCRPCYASGTQFGLSFVQPVTALQPVLARLGSGAD